MFVELLCCSWTMQPTEKPKTPTPDVSTSVVSNDPFALLDGFSFGGVRKRFAKTVVKSSKKSPSHQNIVRSNSTDYQANSDSDLDHSVVKSNKILYKNAAKSQIICYRDREKIIAIKNASSMTNYNVNTIERIRIKNDNNVTTSGDQIVKYKNLNEADYAVEDAKDIDFSIKHLQKPKPLFHKPDVISNTVDSWSSKNGSKNMFCNFKDSLFRSNAGSKIKYKPLIFGGTYPIDAPMNLEEFNRLKKLDKSRESRPKIVTKTFDIDRPL